MLLASDLDKLPVLRWADVTGNLTVRTDGMLENVTNLVGGLPNTVAGVFLSLGNNLWSAAAWMLKNLAEPLNGSPAQTLGGFINKFAALLYKSLSSSLVLVGVGVSFVILSALWLTVRNRGGEALKKVGAMILGLALFTGMGMASVGHESTPAPGTPWWLAQTANSIFQKAGDGVADGVLSGVQSLGTGLASGKDPNHLSCRRYLNELDKEAKQGENGVDKASLAVRTLNTMWEETGLRMWARAQYGAGNNGMQVFCRVLEYRAGADASEMASITNAASDGAVNSSENAMVWHPQLALIDDEGKTDDSEDNGTYSHQIDRMIVAFDACGNFGSGYKSRTGWTFVNYVQGKNRGFYGGSMPKYCQAVIEGGHKELNLGKNQETDQKDNEPGPWDVIGTISAKEKAGQNLQQKQDECNERNLHNAASGSSVQYGWAYSNSVNACKSDQAVKKAQKEKDSASDEKKENQSLVTVGTHTGTADAKLRRLAKKFDIGEKSTWRQVAQAQNSGGYEERNAAINTLLQQRGQTSLSDVGGALVFCLSGAINLMIWGIGFGLLNLIASMAVYLLVLFGFWIGLLIYAFAPDKGKGAVARALKNTIGCCAASSLTAIVCVVCDMFITLSLNVVGFTDNNGNTSGTILMGGVLSAALPIVFFKGLQYLCVKVWRIGDPLSIGNIGRLISGKAAFEGIGRVVGTLGAGGAALMAGGGLSGAVNAMSGAMHGGGVLSNIARGQSIGQREAYYKGRNGGGKHGSNGNGAGRGDSAAEKAAAQKPTTAEWSEAEKAIRDEYGDKLDEKALEEKVSQRAGFLHQFHAEATEAAEALHSKHKATNISQLAGDLALVRARREARTGRDADGNRLNLSQRANRLAWYAGKRVSRAKGLTRMRAEHALDATERRVERIAHSRLARSIGAVGDGMDAAVDATKRVAGDNWRQNKGYAMPLRVARTVAGMGADAAGAAAHGAAHAVERATMPVRRNWDRYANLNPVARAAATTAASTVGAARAVGHAVGGAVSHSTVGRIAGLDHDYAAKRDAQYTTRFIDPQVQRLNRNLNPEPVKPRDDEPHAPGEWKPKPNPVDRAPGQAKRHADGGGKTA